MAEELTSYIEGYKKVLSVRVDTATSRICVDRTSLALLIEEHQFFPKELVTYCEAASGVLIGPKSREIGALRLQEGVVRVFMLPEEESE